MLRFTFVGDSMTIGSAGELTWRYRMWQHLRAAYGDGAFEIAGPRETLHDKTANAPVSHDYADADPAFPRNHLAGWGEGWLHMAPVIEEAVALARTDVLLISLGLIDLGFYTNAEQTAQNVRRFVAGARAANPRVRMALLPVIPNVRAETDAPFAAEVAHFNTLLAKAVADLDSGPSPCSSRRCRSRTTSTRTRTTARTRTRAVSASSRTRSPWRCVRRGVRWAPRPRALPRVHSTPLAGDS